MWEEEGGVGGRRGCGVIGGRGRRKRVLGVGGGGGCGRKKRVWGNRWVSEEDDEEGVWCG